jgi:hypothetical protein
MTDDNLHSPDRRPKWRIGELSIGTHSHEDLLAQARSFLQTELFLDAVEDILKTVDVVFGLRPRSEDAFLSFLDPPPQRDEVALIRTKLVVVYLAWQIARDGNPALASFNGDSLEGLRNEIHRVNRDAIDAARNGSKLQKLSAGHESRQDITNAFYKLNRELGIQRAKYDLPGRVRGVNDHEDVGTVSGQDNPMKGLKAIANPHEQVPEEWLSPLSVADLAKETRCSRTTINDEVRNGSIPGGALRENNKPRGHVILQQIGLDYLKRKSGKDKKDRR